MVGREDMAITNLKQEKFCKDVNGKHQLEDVLST